MVNIPGTALDAAQADFLREHHIRAVCLFRGNLGSEAEVRRLTADLRDVMGDARADRPRPGRRLGGARDLPAAAAGGDGAGRGGDAALAEAVGAAVARGVRSLGFNWNFAPVLDVNNNPANPVIAERSFSEDPHEVTRLAGAWMRGALREGVACCVKHFPGHGDTHVDSHLDLPVVDKSLAELRAARVAAVHALSDEAPAMMTAHIVYPQLDPDHPATLSRRILGGLLRERLGLRRRRHHRLAGDEGDPRTLRPRPRGRAGAAGRRRHGDGARHAGRAGRGGAGHRRRRRRAAR